MFGVWGITIRLYGYICKSTFIARLISGETIIPTPPIYPRFSPEAPQTEIPAEIPREIFKALIDFGACNALDGGMCLCAW